MNLKYCAAISLLLSLFFFQSCKQGCTNKKAYNFSPSAKQDDGSCLYCDSIRSQGVGETISIEDMTVGSPHQYNYVVFLTVTSTFLEYQGNGCKLLHGTTSGESSIFYTANIKNETNSTVTFSGTIQIMQSFTGTILTFPVSNVIIPPNSFVNVDLGSGGNQSQFSSFNLSVFSPTFSYH